MKVLKISKKIDISFNVTKKVITQSKIPYVQLKLILFAVGIKNLT